MPKFKFHFSRTYEIVEGFERLIEARLEALGFTL